MKEFEELFSSIKTLIQEGKWNELSEYLQENGTDATRIINAIDAVYATFDESTQSLGYLVLLLYKISLQNIGEFDIFISQIKQLIEKANIEENVLDKYCQLLHTFTNIIEDQNLSMHGILLLKAAFKKIQTKQTQLTSLHADFLQLCLSSKCMKPALEVLDTDIRSINTENGTFDAKAFLLYYYYGAMIYLSMKIYDKAAFFLQSVLTTPSSVVSHIMLEAFKKYQLVSLLLDGKVPPLPKYTSAVVTRYLKNLSQQYIELVETYAKHDPELLRVVANKHRTVFQTDKNFGLVKQVINSLIKKKIQKLTKTFLTLSLTDMATRVNLRNAEEAEILLLEMIEDGIIYGKIDEEIGVVTFQKDPDGYCATEILKQIENQMGTCAELNEELEQMDRELKTDAQYLQKIISQGPGDDQGKEDGIFG